MRHQSSVWRLFIHFLAKSKITSQSPLVVLLLGLPGSGKSTLAARLVALLGPRARHIEFDALGVGWSGKGDSPAGDSFDKLNHVIESRNLKGDAPTFKHARGSLLATLRDALLESDNESVLIIDDNFYYSSMRREVWRVCLDRGFFLARV